MNRYAVVLVIVALVVGLAVAQPAMAERCAAVQVDYCASPFLWLYKASGGALDLDWYGPVAAAFNCLAETGNETPLRLTVRLMGLSEHWEAYYHYCQWYIAQPVYEPMVEVPLYCAVVTARR